MAYLIISPKVSINVISISMCKYLVKPDVNPEIPLNEQHEVAGWLVETEEFSPDPKSVPWFVVTAVVRSRPLQIAIKNGSVEYLRAVFSMSHSGYVLYDSEIGLTTADYGLIMQAINDDIGRIFNGT